MKRLIVGVVLGVVLAGGGVAWASGLIITRLDQIKPSVREQLRGPQAWAQVAISPNGPFVNQGHNVRGVTSPSSGIYCLELAASVKYAPGRAVVSIDNAVGFQALVQDQFFGGGTCPSNKVEVDTYDLNGSSPTLSGLVNFSVIVP
jgi:hypothetical protein